TYYTAPVATAPAGVVSGTVVRFDQPNTIVLSDGRVVPATAQTVVMVDNRAVPLTTIQPGASVVIYPNGTQAVVTNPYASPAFPVYRESGRGENETEPQPP